ncbi:hypothetical protein AGOR_G00113480 [Albula goreensis]|uniref:Scaffolding anchor of CK1 domain-containing protein n=1 Tax=Albula goreensis TaxID=1534307 RepID=A0A8T3DDB0_9TELE|nr:hypothetical protein AGOR_G00113480 [Albula goreensis]
MLSSSDSSVIVPVLQLVGPHRQGVAGGALLLLLVLSQHGVISLSARILKAQRVLPSSVSLFLSARVRKHSAISPARPLFARVLKVQCDPYQHRCIARARAEVPDAATAMNLSSDGLMVECYLRPRQVGKVKRRVQEMRYVSALTTEMDLSHNESARLATDALLDRGLTAYQQVLASEGEVDFLSELEKDYILGNATHQANGAGSGDTEEEQEAPASPPGSSETYFPVCSESEPPGLEYGWPVPDWSYHLQGKPSVEVLFRADRSASIKDLLRENISKATTLLAIVMDIFTDVEIFCDLLEATRKRGVSVYLLLNHVNLSLFLDMCKDLSISSTHLTKMSIRSVQGETYCAKSGRKFSGQIKENFVIIDCTQAFAGSFSFTWLSWQVHRSLAVLVKGSGVKPFDLEFRRLYASSKPVTGLPTAAPPLDIAKPLGHGQSLLPTRPPAALQPHGCPLPWLWLPSRLPVPSFSLQSHQSLKTVGQQLHLHPSRATC